MDPNAEPLPLIFDTETTGGDEPKLIEAAYIRLPATKEISLTKESVFNQRYNPGAPSTVGALATHHILDDELFGQPPASEFKLPINPYDGFTYLIGHNVDYDWQMAGSPEGVRRICTLALSRFLWPTLDSHKLGAVAYSLLPQEKARRLLQGAHAAYDDCETTRHILLDIVKVLRSRGMEPRWSALWVASELARIPQVMAFGKHKGVPINELPGDYVSWLLRQPDLDPYLIEALNRR